MALQLLRKGKQREAVEDPTKCLDGALARFKGILTPVEQQQFAGSSAAVPDAGAVLFFVAQLDAENASKSRRSIAPRLCTFLSATQQFTGAIGTFVSSNPAIASLVWGGIQTAITVASNVASYFDKVTNMIKDIGLFCPTFQQFGQLFHGHIGLQNALCEYYAVIIETCTRIIEVSRRPASIQTFCLIWNPFESEFKPFLDRLMAAKQHIDLQVSLASKQADQEAKKLLEHESNENSLFRPSALNLLKKSTHQQDEARQWQINRAKREIASLKIKIQRDLCPVDHMQPWKRTLKQRVHSTAEWLIQQPAFIEWRDSPHSSIMWCPGTMGMGKTVLMSNVVSHLHSSCRQTNSVAYFFCMAENKESLSARNIIGSIARQLLDSLIQTSSHDRLLSIQSEVQSLDTDDIVEFLLSKLKIHHSYYIILDGLDECEHGQIRGIAKALEAIFQAKIVRLKIICAGRPDLDRNLFKAIRPEFRIVIDEEKLKIDMDRFITATLDECLQEGLLVIQDPNIVITIVDVLRKGARGMFLWAGLCIKDLCEKNSDQDILDALHHLPRDLADLFDSKIRRIQRERNSQQTIDLLRYCGVVKRPLTVEEYREALSVSLEDKYLDTKKLPNDMNRVVRGCFGLTFIDDEEYTIHYIHQSVKDHLFNGENERNPRFDVESINKQLGALCMTYLNFSNFNRKLTKVEKRVLIDPLSLATSSINPQVSRVNKIALKLLSSRKDNPTAFEFQHVKRTALEVLEDSELRGRNTAGVTRNAAFLVYAQENWAFHLTGLQPHEETIWILFCRCIQDRSLPLERRWENYDPVTNFDAEQIVDVIPFVGELSAALGYEQSELAWTLQHNHYALLLYFNYHSKGRLHFQGIRSFPVFKNGTSYRWLEVLIHVPLSSHTWGMALVNVASDEGLSEAELGGIFVRLLEKMANFDPTAASNALGFLLRYAFEFQNLFITLLSVDKVLNPENRVTNKTYNSDINSSHTSQINPWQMNPLLIIAVTQGKQWTVDAILDSGADPNVYAHESSNTALHLAVWENSADFLKKLLSAGADVSLLDQYGKTAFDLAVSVDSSWNGAMKDFVAAGVDLDLKDGLGKTALHRAAEEGRLEMVRSLVSAGANIHLRNGDGRTAFHVAIEDEQLEKNSLGMAVENGDLDMLRLLVSIGADVDLKDFFGETALQMATKYDERLDFVEYLVSVGADINMRDFLGYTALHEAAKSRWSGMNMLKYLVSAGADVNLAADDGHTALTLSLLQWRSAGFDLKSNFTEVEYLAAAVPAGQIYPPGIQSIISECLPQLARFKALAVVELLVRSGADIDSRGFHDSQTALHWASAQNHHAMVLFLLESGADPNKSDTRGQTALHYAAEGGFEEVAACLLRVADASIIDFQGRTALMCARNGSHHSIVKMLLPFAGPRDDCVDDDSKTLEYWANLVNIEGRIEEVFD
ncbi:hypothetical protein N7454_001656 [Penicillium verhagenii]|nr:hypothetical protein N7454_001656 [Penicillium verhagenii]